VWACGAGADAANAQVADGGYQKIVRWILTTESEHPRAAAYLRAAAFLRIESIGVFQRREMGPVQRQGGEP